MKKIFFVLSVVLAVFLFCEFIIYYLVIYQCSWPKLDSKEPPEPTVKAIILADTHLLGPRDGHWFDKLRREWQMHRAFQTALTIFNPTAVFILGDIFDEGQWSDSEQFATYLNRFKRLFYTGPNVELLVIPGNHDVGFHYIMTPRLIHQFQSAFNLTAVQLRSFGGSHFVIVNSMAFEGDGCNFCVSAERQLLTISKKLDCDKRGKCPEGRPVLLQHFPMFRRSDSLCSEPDDAPDEIKKQIFKEQFDCLSRNASEKMYDWLNPRLIFTGHTHHGCHTVHRGDINEFTQPSFSWRNKNNPSFMLAVISPTNHAVFKCLMPRESTVITLYTSVLAFLVLTIFIWLVGVKLYLKFMTYMHKRTRMKLL